MVKFITLVVCEKEWGNPLFLIVALRRVELKIAEELGYEYVDCEFVRDGQENDLIIYIDQEKGITLDDCEKVSRAVEEVLDREDPIEQSYVLVVSSPGLDRPLKKARDFEKNMGKQVDVKLYRAQGKKKKFTGYLIGYDGETMSIEQEGKKETFACKDVALVRLHIEF